MKTILVINDQSAAAEHAALFALDIAKKMQANILLANMNEVAEPKQPELIKISHNYIDDIGEQPFLLIDRMRANSDKDDNFKPWIDVVDFDGLTNDEIVNTVISHNVWMMVTGAVDGLCEADAKKPNVQAILNRVRCPLLIIPESYNGVGFKNIVYCADLRFCRVMVAKYLAELARPYQANLMFANLSAKGLPHMEDSYALTVFNEEVYNKVNYEQLYFNNIRERDLCKAADVMIHTMHTDLLAVVHHRFHFTELVGPHIDHSLPEYLIVPVIVFPY
jgi:nucleotide-binding universal stress UspA family protein